MMRWIQVFALLLLSVILAGCASDSSVVYSSHSHLYYPHHDDSDYYYDGWSMYPGYPHWRGHEIEPLPAKNIDDLSVEEKRRTVDTVNRINLYNSDPNRGLYWWDRRRIRLTTGP